MSNTKTSDVNMTAIEELKEVCKELADKMRRDGSHELADKLMAADFDATSERSAAWMLELLRKGKVGRSLNLSIREKK